MSTRQGHRNDTTIQLSAARIDVRESIEIRSAKVHTAIVYYLSSFSDEIDGRSDIFNSLFEYEISKHELVTAITHATSFLELTDTVLLEIDLTLFVLRGPSANFPLYRSTDQILSTSLPQDDDLPISRSGLLKYMTEDLVNGIFEPNLYLETQYKNWYRFRRGAITILQGLTNVEEIPFPVNDNFSKHPVRLGDVISILQNAFEDFRQSQRMVSNSVLELSGGFDSTLAGAAALSGNNHMSGISATYPFYEFQHEAPLQQLIAKHLKISRREIDGSLYLPYSEIIQAPVFDEPSKFVTGAGFTQTIGKYAQSLSASKVFVGHGGDDLFDIDIDDLRTIHSKIENSFFTKSAQIILENTLGAKTNASWLSNKTGLFTYDGRLDCWIKEYYGASIRSPFTDLKVFHAAKAWSAFCRSKNRLVDKSIIAQAFSNILPLELLERRGKIRYEGVWARAYHLHGISISGLIDNSSEIFETIGIVPSKIINRIKALQNYQTDNEGHVISAYALAHWLNSRNLKKTSDANWLD